MSKTYELKIQTAHNDEEIWAYSKGHHDDAAFIAAAKKFGCQKDDDEDEGYQLEEIVRSHINTSIQRCLVKAIALHGLGLYIYAGEDLPQVITDAANDAQTAPTTKVAPKPPRSSASRRVRQPPPAPSKPGGITDAQQQHIQALAQEAGIAIERVLAYFQVAALQDIPADVFTRVVRSLEKRRAAA